LRGNRRKRRGSGIAKFYRKKVIFCDNICDQVAVMLLGYARVSTDDQNLDLQRTALTEAGCGRIYEEKLSGASRNRPELARLLDHLRRDDVVVVYRLDRLARSTRVPLPHDRSSRPEPCLESKGPLSRC
jgi:predicted site-specific integrase-resolvase